jgi:hypothetical protein
MKLTLAHKIMAFIMLAVSLINGVGVYSYLPKQQESTEKKLEKIEERMSLDHDTLIRVEVTVKELSKKLERNGIVNDYEKQIDYLAGTNVFDGSW